MKNTLEGIKNKLDETKDEISELEDMVRKHSRAATKWKRLKNNEEGLREIRDNIKYNSIHIIGMPEGEEKELEIRNLFEKNNKRQLA